MSTTQTQVQATTNNGNQTPEPNAIEEVISVIEMADLNVLESAKQIEDINLRRNTIAEHLIDVAHQNGLMKSTKKPLTMREKVYNVLATTTSDSRKLYLALAMKTDVLDNIKNKAELIEANKWRIK
jgi:hypothetical protein